MSADFIVHGAPMSTVYLLEPITTYAADWIEQHIPLDAPMLGNSVAVEHRYVGDIVRGIQNEGLTVKRSAQ